MCDTRNLKLAAEPREAVAARDAARLKVAAEESG